MITSIRWPLVYSEFAQANSHTIVTVYNNYLSNATSNHFFFVCHMNKTCVKQPLQNFAQQSNGKQMSPQLH